jgi:lipid-A-disaccharide synthase
VPISKKESLKVLIVAAEASSAAYAQQLLQIWNENNVSWTAAGIGSRDMEALGFQILGRSEELAVVGLQEIIAHWGDIKKAFHAVVNYATTEKPDFILLMDYPEFNLRLAKKMKSMGVPVVYYISPQIWAWRSYRVHNIKKIVDLMLVIFPFEEAFYKNHGLATRFVGHPLLEMLAEKKATPQKIEYLRAHLLGDDRKTGKKRILGLMPGSRKSELKYNLKTQIETAQKVVEQCPDAQPVLFIAPSLDEKVVREQALQFGYKGLFLKEDPFLMIHTADEILCASGTATLMVGLCEKPMVIMYRMNAISGYLAKWLVNKIPYFGMVNLIAEREIIPERFQERATVEELSRCLLQIISDQSLRKQMIFDLKQLKTKLGDGNGLQNLSQALLEFAGL